MKKEEFFPKVKLEGTKLVLNSEAVETMDLDTEGSKVIFIKTLNPDKAKNNVDILMMKTNGSMCDDPENIKDVFSPDAIRPVAIQKEGDDVLSGVVDISKNVNDAITSLFGKDQNEFKLLVCNIESPLGKEFKEQFDITNNYYKFAAVSDKRFSVGKEKTKEQNLEERININ